ncbi:sensor domain-containing protein [Magnetococcus sp. PR-3]|uniref:sensor domain-containing protein n=1 Tax=Magnetococcus sp. PR-3 TaxID=3120355 RepID=UPI002FCE16CE
MERQGLEGMLQGWSASRRIVAMMAIMVGLVILVGGITTYVLYQNALSESQLHLMDSARQMALNLQQGSRGLGLSNTSKRISTDEQRIIRRQKVLVKLRERLVAEQGRNRSLGYLTIIQAGDQDILILLAEDDLRNPAVQHFSYKNNDLHPFVKALQGHVGSAVALNVKAQPALFGYAPIPELEWAITMHLPLEHVRGPFLRIAWGLLLASAVVMLLGGGLFLKVGRPLISGLERYQARLGLAMEASRIGIWEWDVLGGQMVWDEGMYRIFDCKSDAFDGTWQGFLSRLNTEDAARLEQYRQGSFSHQARFEVECRTREPGDGQKIVSLRGELHMPHHGVEARLIGACWDITSQKRAEQKLRESRHQLDRAQRLASLGYWTWDLHSGDQFWSNEIYRMLHRPKAHLSASFESYMDHVHPDDRKRVKDMVDRVLKEPDMFFRVEHRIVRSDGSTRTVLQLGDVERNASGEPQRMTGTVQDVTDLKRTQENLDLAKYILDTTSDAVIITDVNNRIIDVNRAYTQITGFSRTEVMGENPQVVHSGDQGEEIYARIWQSILQEGHWSGEVWERRKDGELFPKWMTMRRMLNEYGETAFFVGVFVDISTQKATEEQLERLAYYDPLTKLPNRALFQERLTQAIATAKRYDRYVGVLLLDLNRFKLINETYGHGVGDALLTQVAERIQERLRESDIVARINADTFAVTLSDLNQEAEVTGVANMLLKQFTTPFHVETHEFMVRTAMGIALYPSDGGDAETLLRHVENALGQAKKQGANSYRFYSVEMSNSSNQRLALEQEMHTALVQQDFVLHYQPKVDLRRGVVTGVESLIRWQHGSKGMISPAQFIPVAEETGLIVPMGQWILETACAQAKEISQQLDQPFTVAVNLSARQFQQRNLVDSIAEVLKQSRIDPAMLELEITESMMMGNVEKSIETLVAIRDMGVALAIDDFGTGYSSLSYLKRFPINTLKIDQSFVRDLAEDSGDAAIVSAIISMAQDLNLHVVAEGAENPEQVQFLKKRGCETVQGYFFSRPLPKNQLQTFLADPDAVTMPTDAHPLI